MRFLEINFIFVATLKTCHSISVIYCRVFASMFCLYAHCDYFKNFVELSLNYEFVILVS